METSETTRPMAASEGEAVGKTGVTARGEEAPPEVPPLLAAGVAVAATLGAAVLIRAGTPQAVSGGVLLAVVALVAAAVLLGGERYGAEEREGRLALSVRIGLGLLGGAMGGLVAAAAEWLVGTLGLTAALGVEITGRFPAAAFGLHVLGAALWGMIFGAALGAVPGRGVLSRGAAFALLPALWMLLKVFPIDRGLGFFGVELGSLTFLFVFLFWLLWGVTTAWVIAWGERTEIAPLDRPLGA